MFGIYLLFFCAIASLCLGAQAQDAALEKLSQIRPMVSMRPEVEKIYGIGENEADATWYYFNDHSVKIIYSDGTCVEGWLTHKDTVIKASLFFFDGKDLSKLRQRVNYTKFKRVKSFDNMGEKHYYDELNGFKYGINDQEDLWYSLTLYPSKKYSQFRCKE